MIVVAVRTRLLAISALTALVASRVYPVKLPQSPTLPAVRLTQIGEIEPMQLRGSSGLARARVQVDAIAKEAPPDWYAEAQTVMAAVHGRFSGGVATGLKGWRGTVAGVTITGIEPDGVREGYEPGELRQVFVSRDYLVTFKTN